jgi:hypothetical protein
MSEEQEVLQPEVVTGPHPIETKAQNYQEAVLEAARAKLSRYLPRAVEIITELAETSENDRVRLAAAESIADRAGLGKSSTTQVNVSASQHEAARKDAEDVIARLKQNKSVSAPVVEPDLDTLIVLEGEEVA